MTDRQMIEDAALAAGMVIEWKEGHCKGGPYAGAFVNGVAWRPREDDGDSARLRRAVRIVVQWFPKDVAAMHWSDDGRGRSWVEFYGDDPAAAERLAVVRAAAAIGAKMRETTA